MPTVAMGSAIATLAAVLKSYVVTLLAISMLGSACGRLGYTNEQLEPDVVPGPFDGPPSADAGPDAALQVTRALEVTVLGGGRVISDPPGLDCVGTCQASFPVGTSVRLTAIPDVDTILGDWQDYECLPSGDCEVVLDQDTTTWAAFESEANYIFTTSGQYTGNLGGVSGADALCNAHAAGAGLPGTYVALLSTDSVNAIDRLSGARGWRRPDGRPVFDLPADLIDDQLYFPPRLDESGERQSPNHIWTGSDAFGVFDATAPNCANWTAEDSSTPYSRSGDLFGGTAYRLFRGSSGPCSNPGSILCAGIDRDVPVGPSPPREGRIAFVAEDWSPSTGIESADALCNDSASAAGLSGTYRAALSTTTASAASRFDLTGPAWVRTDGTPRAATARALFSVNDIDVPLRLDATGQAAVGTAATGSYRAYEVADLNCGDWSDPAGITRTGVLDSSASGVWSGLFQYPCDEPRSLYCLQE